MTYHCGIGPGMAKLGLQPREPHIVCDDCRATVAIVDRPPAWFMSGKPPPGWRQTGDEPPHQHYCGICAIKRGLKPKLGGKARR